VRHAPRPPRFLTAGLPCGLLADALVGEIADLVGLLVGLVQRLIAALLALLTVERVLRLVRQSSGIHAGLLRLSAVHPVATRRDSGASSPSLRHATDLSARPRTSTATSSRPAA
jgi:hypothetical protein